MLLGGIDYRHLHFPGASTMTLPLGVKVHYRCGMAQTARGRWIYPAKILGPVNNVDLQARGTNLDVTTNCHGFALRTHEAPHGPFWIDWPEMVKILTDGWRRLTRADRVLPGDLIVWADDHQIEHSAIVRQPVYERDGISEETLVDSKNGLATPDRGIPIYRLRDEYKTATMMLWRLLV